MLDLLPWVVIAGALVAVALFLFSRISRENLLENANRKAIYEAIVADPGTTAGQVARDLQLSYKTVERHVDRLVQGGLVVTRRDGTRRRLFENHGRYEAKVASLMIALQTGVARRIAREIAREEETVQTKLAKRAGLPLSTVNHHVARLAKLGALVKRRQGRLRVLSLAPDWRDVVVDCLKRYDATNPVGHSS